MSQLAGEPHHYYRSHHLASRSLLALLGRAQTLSSSSGTAPSVRIAGFFFVELIINEVNLEGIDTFCSFSFS